MEELVLGEHRFTRIEYDEIPVYLYVGETGMGRETPEGHIVWEDERDQVVGVTLVSPQRQVERDGRLSVTLPDGTAHDVDRLRTYVPELREEQD